MGALPADYLIINVDRAPLCHQEFAGPKEAFVFYTSESWMEQLRRNGPQWKFHSARLLQQTIEDPAAIFKGLKREGLDDGLCYTANHGIIPGEQDNPLVRVQTEYLFLVFVNSGRVVIDWEFRPGDPGRYGRPANSDRDFDELIWVKEQP